MPYLEKFTGSWRGSVRWDGEQFKKRFPTEHQAEKWEGDMLEKLWQPYVRKALEMYAKDEHRDKIEEIFKEDFDIDLKECLVPTDNKRFKFSFGNPWGEMHTIIQTEASFEEIGKEFGFSRQRAKQIFDDTLAKYLKRYKRVLGFAHYEELSECYHDEICRYGYDYSQSEDYYT